MGWLIVKTPATNRQNDVPMMRLARHMPRILLLVTLALPGLVDAQLYRWVDDDGRIHYSDSLPPDRASDERREFSRSGQALRDVERAPTESEIRALEEARREAARTRAEEQEQRRRQSEYDRMLTVTYSSVGQLEETRDERIERIRALVNASTIRQERYDEEIISLREQAAQAERRGTGDAEEIYQRLETARERLKEEQSYMNAQKAEIGRIQDEFTAHISRFKELGTVE